MNKIFLINKNNENNDFNQEIIFNKIIKRFNDIYYKFYK